LTDTDGNNLYLYKKPNAVVGTDTPDATISLGGGDMSGKINALAAICGATWNGTTKEYDITLDSHFGSNTDTIVKALNELKLQILALDNEATIATVNSGVVTLKAGLLQTDGLVANAPGAAQSTVIDGYLNTTDGKFYEESTYTTEITPVTTNSYKDLTTNKVYNWNGTAYLEVKPDITLAKVATTGTAADVAIVDSGSKITATDVEGALAELADGEANKKVYFTDNTSTTGTDYAAIYKIYQGTGSAASPVAGELVGTINIPKDQFLDDAGLVDIFFDSSDNTLHEGSISGPDVTEAIMGTGVTPTAANAGKYMKFVFELTSGPSAKSTIYISVKELSHVYTGGSTSEIAVSVNASTDVITATIVDVDGTKVTYIAASAATYTQLDNTATYDATQTYYVLNGDNYEVDGTVDATNFDTKVANGLYIEATPAVGRESVSAALARIDGSDSTTGSVAKKIKDAIGALDTVSDVSIASYVAGTSGAADVITITGSIKEQDGLISAGTGDNVTFSNITTAQINALFS